MRQQPAKKYVVNRREGIARAADLFETENTVAFGVDSFAFSTRDWFPIASLSR